MPDGAGSVSDRGGSFPGEARIRDRRDFLATQAAGVRFTTPHFIVILRPASGAARVGITASKRVGNAVVRNRWKRMVREAFRRIRPELDRSLDAVVIARTGTRPPSLVEADAELRDVLRRWRGGGARSDRRPRP